MMDMHQLSLPRHGTLSGSSHQDVAETRRRLEALARTLDTAFRIPGTSVRIGADAVLNLLPGIGTLAAKGLSSYIIYEARRLGVPRTMMARMIADVGVDFVISAIPVIGWFGDAFYRANSRNIALLIAHLDRHEANRRQPAYS
jgi:Domain of unknown function (DUF4112)